MGIQSYTKGMTLTQMIGAAVRLPARVGRNMRTGKRERGGCLLPTLACRVVHSTGDCQLSLGAVSTVKCSGPLLLFSPPFDPLTTH